MIKIGVSQIKNSTRVEENFSSIMKALNHFQLTDTDLIIFPECSLSGFSAKIKECTLDLVRDYLSEIEKWSKDHNKFVILPTAIVDQKIYNTGFIFGNNMIERFYKLGLTDSEKTFFTVPEVSTKKIFCIKEYKVAILICFEAQMDPWTYFKEGEADLILWPGYWGWEKEDSWHDFKREGEPNLIHQNMKKWRRPLIQSNFAFNDLEDHRSSGPHGLSMFIDKDNSLFFQAEADKESCYQITIDNGVIENCVKVGDL